MAIARTYGRLRRVDQAQAPVVRRAAVLDRRVLPRWQRGGDGHHEHAAPSAFTDGVHWARPETPHDGRERRVLTRTGVPHLAWRSRDHWLSVVVGAVLDERGDVLAGRVSQVTFLRWAEGISLYAHGPTGRRVIVRPDRLAELVDLSKRTIDACQRVAEDLGLYVVLSPGRMLTQTETLRCREQGSRQRGLSNEAALVVPRWLLKATAWTTTPVENHTHQRVAHQITCTPTSGRNGSLKRNRYLVPLTRFADRIEPPSAAQHRPGRFGQTGPDETQDPPQRRTRRRYDPAALDLARTLTQTLPWLRDVPAGRIETQLRRFAHARLAWTAADLATAIDLINHRLSRAAMTHDLVRAPIALLASYLRDLDVDADHPRPEIAAATYRPTPLTRQQQINRERAARARATAADPDTRRYYATIARQALHTNSKPDDQAPGRGSPQA